jgi:hypothetical protein
MHTLIPTEDNTSTTPTTKMAPLRLPCQTRVLGDRYRVRRLIGRGGMADVYVGDDLLLDRVVAIKILHPHIGGDSSGLERFRREAMALAAVTSPHIVSIHDIGLESDAVYLVMQHIEGHTIEQEIAQAGSMAQARATKVLAQVLDGLAAMHVQGLLHRDIKPSNVLVDRHDHVVLVDLGIALDTRRAPLTAPGMVAGTVGYLPPESQTGAASEPTGDVYQVGLLSLFLLTGVDAGHRAEGAGFDDLIQQLPETFANVVRRALATDPTARFPSPDQMKQSLEAALEQATCRQTETPREQPRARDRSEQRPLTHAVAWRDPRATTEITTAALLTLLTDTCPVVANPPTLRPDTRTTEIKAEQILSVQACGEVRATGTGARRPCTRIPVVEILEAGDVCPLRRRRAPWLLGGGALAIAIVLSLAPSAHCEPAKPLTSSATDRNQVGVPRVPTTSAAAIPQLDQRSHARAPFQSRGR